MSPPQRSLCQQCLERDATVAIHYSDGTASRHFCDACASQFMETPIAAHRFSSHFEPDRVLRITFKDGDVMRLKDFDIVDPTIYGDSDRWTSTVVEAVEGNNPDFARLFRPGSGLDFNESDIAQVIEESASAVLFTDHGGAGQ